MKKIIYSFLLVLISACSNQSSKVLEYEDVQFFKAESTESNGLKYLNISGLAFHSSLVVKEMVEINEKDSKVIIIKLMPTSEGKTGSFNYAIEIGNELASIKFGEKKHTIWLKEN